MLTGMEKRMYDSQKHQAKITTQDGDIFIGLCKYFTSALDNEPEEACLTMESPTKNFWVFSFSLNVYLEFIILFQNSGTKTRRI